MIHGSFPPHQFSHEYKRSTSCSATVVEARRSGDVWLSKGNAIDGKSKLGRAVGMLQARPKLSVLPPEDNDEVLEEPPVPFGDESSGAFHVDGTPRSEMNAQFGRLRKESRTGVTQLWCERESGVHDQDHDCAEALFGNGADGRCAWSCKPHHYECPRLGWCCNFGWRRFWYSK